MRAAALWLFRLYLVVAYVLFMPFVIVGALRATLHHFGV